MLPTLRRSPVVLALAIFLVSCGGGSSAVNTPTVASVTLSRTTATLVQGATLQLTATALDGSGVAISGQTIDWSTSAATIATVSGSGLVTAVAFGTATVTASAGGKTAGATITVQSLGHGVTFSVRPTSANLVPGATVQLLTAAFGSDGDTLNPTVGWATNAGAVATVSGSGLVSAVAVGAATITATFTLGTSVATATVDIAVQAGGGVIGAAGGTVTSADGNATVVIPAGALSANTAISVAPVTPSPANPTLLGGTAYELLPSGTTFAVPVTLNLKYSAAAVPVGHSQGVLQMRTLVGGTWTPLAGATADTVNHVIQATTTHFSVYVIAEPPVALYLRNADNFSATTAINGSLTICQNDSKRILLVFYDPAFSGFTPSVTWSGPSAYSWGGGELAANAVGIGVTIVGVDVGTSDINVTVNSIVATIHVTVTNASPPCAPPMFVYTRDVSGADNVQLWNSGVTTQLTNDNTSHFPSATRDAVGAAYTTGHQLRYTGGLTGGGPGTGAGLRQVDWLVYTSTGFLEGYGWPDLSHIQFAESASNGLYSLFRINVDGSGKAPFAPATVGGSVRVPSIAPNGSTYFAYFPPASINGPTQLYRVDASGNNLTALLPVSGWVWTPVVSQDGQWLAMSVENLGFTAAPIFMYDLNNTTAAPVQVSPSAGYAYSPTFCGPGVIYYTYSTTNFSPWTLYRWDIVSRTSTPVAFTGSGSFPEGISIRPQQGITDRNCPK